MKYWMMVTPTGEPYSYKLKVLYHDNPHELEWLFPGVKVVELPKRGIGRPLMKLRDHPDMQAVRFPIEKGDFW